jgi:hypothetical protein
LPSIIPGYVYTFLATIIIGGLLIYASNISTVNIENNADQQQLKNLAEYIAAESCELVSAATVNNLTIKSTLSVPPNIGNKEYWIQLTNETSEAWVQVGFGTNPVPTETQTSMPINASASGNYTSGSSKAFLECYTNDSGTFLELSGGY